MTPLRNILEDYPIAWETLSEGYKVEVILGRYYFDVWHKASFGPVRKILSLHSEKDECEHYELRWLPKTKKWSFLIIGMI